jgi:hypothetical protein
MAVVGWAKFRRLLTLYAEHNVTCLDTTYTDFGQQAFRFDS